MKELENFADKLLPGDLMMGHLLLARDPIFRMISKEDCVEIIKYSIASGKRVAQEVLKEFEIRDPIALTKKFGINVVILEEEQRIGNTIQLSEYSPKYSRIIIYKKSISEVIKFLNDGDLSRCIKFEDALSVCVAHELFHFIEEKKIGPLRDKLKIYTITLGPIRIKSGISAASEIAAHAFAKELLSTRFYRALIDCLISFNHSRFKTKL